MKRSRVVLAVTASISFFAIGFVVWYWLFALLYVGVSIVSAVVSVLLFAIAVLRKRKSEYSGTFAGISSLAGILLAGWWARADLCEYAMIAESTRLIVAADAFKKREGRFAHGRHALAPEKADDRLLAWIAGDSVRYGGFEEFYWISRGGAIVGETYSSDRRIWEVSKR